MLELVRTARGLQRALLSAALAVTWSCSRSAPPKLEADPRPAYSVVWGDTPAGVHSYFLEFSQARLRIAGEVSGAWFLAGGQLYRWHQLERVQQVLAECPAPNAEPSDEQATAEAGARASNSSEITVFGAEAERVDASGRVQITAPPSVENATQFDNSITLRASAGPYLFIERASDAMYCGAMHGLNQSSLDTFDLAQQKFVSLPTKPELAELATLALHSQRTALLACLGGRQLGAEALPELEPWSARPILSPTGQLSFELELAMMRTYVEGVVSCPVTVQAASASLSRFAPPRGLDAFEKQRPMVVLRGWSSLAPSELGRVPAIDRLFAEQARRVDD